MDAIEFAPLQDEKTDTLLIKTIASLVHNSTVALPIALNPQSIETSGKQLKMQRILAWLLMCLFLLFKWHIPAKKSSCCFRNDLQFDFCGKKRLCPEVEFSAEDAARSEEDFLSLAIQAAIEAGATIISICDTAGTMMPDEFKALSKGCMNKFLL